MGFILHSLIMFAVTFVMVFVIALCHASNKIGAALTKLLGDRDRWHLKQGPNLLSFYFPTFIFLCLLFGFGFTSNLLHLLLFYVAMGFVTLFLIGSVFVFRYLVKLIDGEKNEH